MVLVDQMIVVKKIAAGLRFSSFEKSENQLLSSSTIFLFNHTFFTDASGSTPGASRKATFGFEICFILMEGSFSSFEKSENQLFFELNCFLIQSYLLFKDASGSSPGASRKSDVWNPFQNDVSDSIPERLFWLIR